MAATAKAVFCQRCDFAINLLASGVRANGDAWRVLRAKWAVPKTGKVP
jgi:hypothetical protein